MKNLVYLKDVATLNLDENKCLGCGICLEVCPHEVFTMNGRHVRINNKDACMECGACSRNCPAGAVSVQAGVGCAAAVINGMLGRNSASCCCVVDPKNPQTGSNDNSCGCG
jgi:NAD-dependent dihydropyrimidine dehydrogenase PreA subunit